MHHIEMAITAWDRETFLAINNGLKCRFFDLVMPRISDMGLGWVQFLALMIVAWWRGIAQGETKGRGWWRGFGQAVKARRWWLVPMVAALALSGLSSDLVKGKVSRERPWWYYTHERQAGRAQDVMVYTFEMQGRPPLKVRGFPSGHATTSFALASCATGLFWRRRSLRGLLGGVWLLAVLIAFSRVYISDHWPLDVLGGALLGSLFGLLIALFSPPRTPTEGLSETIAMPPHQEPA